MTLNPFYTTGIVYFIFSVIALINGLSMGGFEVSKHFFHISAESFLYSFLIDTLSLMSAALVYWIYLRRVRISSKEVRLGKRWGKFLIFHQLAYIVFFLTTGAGLAGSEFSFGGFNAFNYYFIALSPDMITMICLPLLHSNRQYFVASAILLFSFLARGWLGGLIFILTIHLIRNYPVKLSLRTLFFSFIGFPLLLLALPALYAIKWGRRSDQGLSDIFGSDFIEMSADAFQVALSNSVTRLSHLNYSALITEFSEPLSQHYIEGRFRPFWQNGIFYDTACRIFGTCRPDLNGFIVRNMIDPDGKAWNVDVGISGWISILGPSSIFFALLFAVLLMILHIFVIKSVGQRSLDFVFTFFLIYFFHGWVSPFMNLTFYFVLVNFLRRLSFARSQSGPQQAQSAL